MARCCASQGARFTPVSPKPLKADSSRLPLASRAAAETKAAATQARSLIEQAEALGEPSEDHPLLLFSVRRRRLIVVLGDADTLNTCPTGPRPQGRSQAAQLSSK